MESTVCKTDFSYFVRMAVQNNIPWESLEMILKDLTPSLNETREVISILLKELEALQLALKEKDKELEMYQNVDASMDNQNLTSKTKTIQENGQQCSTPESKTIEEEIEVLEVVKENMNDKIILDMNKDSKLSDSLVIENDDHDSDDADEHMGEINNELYTDAKTFDSDTDAPVQEKEVYPETEPSNESEDGKHKTFQDEHGTDESLDNENDKIDTTETTNDSEQIVVSQPKKRLYLCTMYILSESFSGCKQFENS